MASMSALEKTLRYIVLGGIFCMPFVALVVADGVHFFYNLFFPYITGKSFVFRFVVEIMAGAYLALALINPAYRPRRSIVLAALAIFVAIIGLADVLGVHPFKSLWSNFERMDGWVTLAHVLVLTVITSAMVTKEKLWRWLFWVSLGVSAYLAIYGFLQVAGISALGQGGASGLSARIDGTFGNPIYFAAYMLFHVFIAALLWVQQWSERRKGERLALSIAYGTVIAIDTLALLFTGTRGTMLGLAGGVFLTAALVLLQSRNSRLAWRISAITVGVLVVLAAGIWMVKDTTLARKIVFVDRLSTISLEDATVKARFINWSIAWQGVKERPILGWGQENYAIVFDKYYDPRMYAQEPWFDRVHNIVFDWLIAGGFLGLISYLSIFVAALWALWRHGFTVAERSILTGLLAAYFCHNFFVFDNVTSYILFATILAYIVYRAGRATEAKPIFESLVVPRTLLPYVAFACALMTWGVAYGVNGRALAQNQLLLQALAPHQEGVAKNLQYFKEAIATHSYGTQEAREQLSQGTMQIIRSTGMTDLEKRPFYDLAISEMQAQAKESPLDARFPLFLGLLYDAGGDRVNAGLALAKAQELTPKKQGVFFELARNAQLRGDTRTAIEYYKTAYELEMNYRDARFYYAAALISAGRSTEADILLAPLLESGAAADTRVLAAYVERKEYAKAAVLWRAKIAADTSDMQSYFTLAAIYYEGGDRASAIAVLEDAKRVSPAIRAQADALILQIRAGTAR